jgi:transposase-like protein
MSKKETEFAKYIAKHYGTVEQCSSELGVTSQTVYNWINKTPRGMLKFAPEIVAAKDTTWTQLSGEVLYHEDLLKA